MRYLICSFDTPGFLYPMIGLATELRRRGHDLAFATGLSGESIVVEHGFTRLPRGRKDGPSFAVSRWAHALETSMDVKHTEHAIDRFRPDVIITHQLCNGPLIARARSRFPVAVFGGATYILPRQVSPSDDPKYVDLWEWRLRDFNRFLNNARGLFGLPPLDRQEAEQDLVGDLFMVRSVPQLETDLDRCPPQVHAVGACVWEPLPTEQDEAAVASLVGTASKPVLFVQHGRSFGDQRVWNTFVEALRQLNVLAVSYVDRNDVPIGDTPPNLIAVQSPTSSTVLRRAHCVLSRCHTTSFLWGLIHGVPHVAVPAGTDTVDNAARLTASGSGVTLRRECDPSELVSVITGMLTPSSAHRTAAMKFAAAFAAFPGFARPAHLLEQLGSTGKPVLRPS